jgi:hypothetical protein
MRFIANVFCQSALEGIEKVAAANKKDDKPDGGYMFTFILRLGQPNASRGAFMTSNILAK